MTTVDPQAVRERMLELEHIGEGVDRTVGDVAAELARVDVDDAFAQLLIGEMRRTSILCREHYTPRVAVLPNEQQMLTAMVQGMTLLRAIQDLTGQLRDK